MTGLRDGGKQIEERGQNKVHRKDNCTSVQLHVIISVFVSFAARGRHTFASSVALLYDKNFPHLVFFCQVTYSYFDCCGY